MTADGAIDASPSIDAIRFDAMPGDSDGDGVLDTEDNCPAIANPTQHDEDADATGDPCDPCPHLVAAGGGPDGDGDGVGDACDPGAATHRIAHFEPFAAPPGPEWDFSSSWQHVGDRMVYSGSSNSYPSVQWSSGESLVEVGGTSTWNTSGVRQLVVSFGPQEPAIYYYCELYQNSGNAVVAVTRHMSGSYDSVEEVLAPNPLPNGRFRIAAGESVSAAELACEVTLASAAPVTVSAATPGHAAFTEVNFTFGGGSITVDYAIQIVVD
jgi:hypothetical protein